MKRLFITYLLFLSLSSCKEFLDIKPHEETIPESAEEFSALLHTHLNDIDYGTSAIILSSREDKSSLKTYIGNIAVSTSSYYSPYQIIRDCNIILGQLKDTESDMAKNVLGTTYALRGVCYYELMRLYCDVYDPLQKSQLGLQLVTTFDMEERPIRSSLEETMTLIEEDLKKALSYNVQEPIWRFTADVVKGYLARFYFWTRQWDSAIYYAGEVIKNHPLVDREGYKAMMTNGYSLKGNMLIKSELISSSSSEQEGAGTYNSLNYRPVSKRFIDTFSDTEKSNDIRYEMNFSALRIATKFIFSGMRSAEMLLIRAESYYHKGSEDLALADINTLRGNRILNYEPLTLSTLPEPIPGTDYITQDVTGAPLTKLMALILTERRKELFLENDRFYEL
ncbi:MAG: hypothetical protein BHV68_21610, partial [Bacteroidales bacterium 43_8]